MTNGTIDRKAEKGKNVGTNYDDWVEEYEPIDLLRVDDIPFYVGLVTETGGKVLDLTCGTGRVTIPIAQAGLDVVGVDNSSQMLLLATERLRDASGVPGSVEFVHDSILTFNLGKQFDTVLIPYNSFLLFLSVAEQMTVLERVYAHLKPGGILALDLFTPDLWRLTREDSQLYYRADVTSPNNGTRYVLWEQSTTDNLNQIIESRYLIENLSPDGKVQNRIYKDVVFRYIHRYEMAHLLTLSGFEDAEVYGDFQRGDLFEGSEVMVWVAKKPNGVSEKE